MKFSNSIFSIAFLASFIFVVSLASCKDDHDHGTFATITITQPQEMSVYDQGDTVFILGSIAGDGELHGYVAYIRNKATNDTVFYTLNHAHGVSLDINYQWVVDVSDHSDMELGVIVTIDHDDNAESKKVNFHCMP